MEQSKIDISDVYNQANAVTIKASLSICTLALRNGCLCLLVWSKRALASYYGGFHLYLLVFPFVYQFYSIIEALVSSSFANDEFRRISVSFQHHFKIYLLWLLHEKECSFYSYLFCCTEMTWMFIISTTIWVNGWDTSSVASRARSELTSSQCSWKGNRKGKGTDETPHSFLWKQIPKLLFPIRFIGRPSYFSEH